ncbi:anther-specific proline-rich protein APG-like [Hevea brasiliensis]|uniref:anther-specific proline-rich protein APG-like n=1 Tax=Hevea brasiliensis TaxID=3981 RepID=UPI0025E530B9|nr:anther-specific proline-rich protein APG-like [Hevea brasiliensis]
MGTPSSLPTNPNPSPSPPLPQSPPPQTPPLPQSLPPQSPPLPPSQIPPLIPPTPLSRQSEPQNETPILDTHSPEPVPTQTKTKGKTKRVAGRPKETPVRKRKRVPSVPFDLNSLPRPSSEPVSKKTRSSSQTPAPAVQTPVTQSPLHSPAPASSADNIEEDSGYKNIEWQQTVYDPVQFWKDIAPFGGYYRQRIAKASRIVDHVLKYLHRFISYTVLGRGHSNSIVGAASDHNEPTAEPEADPDAATKT